MRIVTVGLLMLLAGPVIAQEAMLPVPLSKPERDSLMQMCEVARWAARIQFEGRCEAMKARFNEAEAKAEKPVKDEPAK